MNLKSFIGTKKFYAATLSTLIPLVIQQGISSFVNLLDNLMVGRLGSEQISAVAIVNQVVFIFLLTIFGCVAGVSIFGAQFHGKGDKDGFLYSFRMKIWMAVIVSAIGIGILAIYGDSLILKFLNESSSDNVNPALALLEAKSYLKITLLGLFPFALSQCFSSTHKDMGETIPPMTASIIAISTNFFLNLLLIFGYLGFPKMGVAGAAIATVIARYVELFYLIFISVHKRKKFTFINDAFRSLKIPLPLVGKIAKTASPLILNELLWATGTTFIIQCYSVRGLNAVTAVNINGTVWNVFSILMMAMGNAIGIILGQLLGANDIEGAKDTAKKLLFFNVTAHIVIGLGIILCAPFIPQLYNISTDIKKLATNLLMVSGLILSLDAFAHGAYFTIRSGGKTFITFLFDCVFTWAVSLPVAFLLTYYTSLSIVWIFFAVQAVNIIKVVIGLIMIKSGIWAKNVVNDTLTENTATV